MKRIFVYGLILALVCALVPVGVWADALEPPERIDVTYEQIPFQVNPLYEDVLSLEDLQLPEFSGRMPDATTMANEEYVPLEQAAVEFREYMEDWQETFEIWVTSDISDYNELADMLFDRAVSHTGESTEGDYLLWHCAAMGAEVYRTYQDGQYKFHYIFYVDYYTTAEQEAELTTAVNQLLEDLDVSNCTDYEKVRAVYDYMCQNITYDYDNLEDETYLLKFTAYAALMDKTAVCQGYASLFYRLMLELDVDVRVIAGIGGGGAHGWNIVELDGLYYNLDTTWDAGVEEYGYFLKSTWNFVGHYRYLDYESMEFHTEFPMAADNYAEGVEAVIDPLIYIGICGDDAYWALMRDGLLVVAGTGAIDDYRDASNSLEYMTPWMYWADHITEVVIDEGITRIGSCAFYDHSKLVSVMLPSTVESIGSNAFTSCDSLNDIQLPDGLTTIEGYAFMACRALSSISIPDSVTQIGNDAFHGCQSLEKLDLGNGVLQISSNAFYNCDALVEVSIPNGVTFPIGRAFRDCDGLETLYIDCSGVPESTFESCDKLVNVTFTDNVTYIGKDAFMDCVSIRELELPDSIVSLSGFYGCTSLVSVKLPANLKTIGYAAFFGCSSLENIEFPETLEVIDGSAFSGCTSLKEVKFPDSLTNIYRHAFGNCTSLTEVTIPSGVTYVTGFNGCVNLAKVNLHDAVTIIGQDAFSGCTALVAIELPESLVEIEQEAFYGCSALTDVRIPFGVTTIGSAAFRNCTALADIQIPDSVTTIKDSAFKNCKSITEITIPASVTYLGSYVFEDCVGLERAYLYNSGFLNQRVLAGCTKLETVVLGDNITQISGQAFLNCTSLKELTMPAKVAVLESYCLQNCSGLQMVRFKGDAPEIKYRAFKDVATTVYYPRNNSTWTEDVRQNYGGTLTWEPYGVCEHVTEIRDAVEPTCSEPGYTGDAYCTICGELVERGSTIPALPHTYETVVTKPTCTEQGYTTYTCTVCGESHVDDYVDPVPHSYEAVVTEPTCTEKGYTTYTCIVCGESHVDDYVDPVPHSYEAVVTEPTCTERGYTTYTCTVCGESHVDDYVDPVPHSYETVVTKPTCTEQGYTTYTCTVCGESHVDDYVDPVPHSYEAVVTEPTCTEKGYTTYTCIVCGESHVDDYMAPVPHSYETVVTEPTCTEQGYTTYTCTVCGESHVDDYVDPVPHSNETVVTEPTCTEGGYTTYTCSICGDSYTDDFVDALGHTWDDETAAVKNCTVCGFRFEGYSITLDAVDPDQVSSVWIDGVEYPVTREGDRCMVILTRTDATNLVVYTLNNPNAEDIHTQYPTGMKVWMLSFEDNAYTARYIAEFDNLLQYSGSSIRIAGNKGIRMITSITKANKAALTGGGLAGYTLVEYGTALCWASDLADGNPLTLGQPYVKSNFAYKRDVADPVFAYTDDLVQYTNVLVGFSLDQCRDDIAMRPYIILEDAQGQQVTIYGGTVYRSIGYIAWQNRNAFKPGAAAYDYVWEIIHHVYSDQFDAEYKG